jgi:hypothetical protein
MVLRGRTDLDLLRHARFVARQNPVFVDFVSEAFRRNRVAERFAASFSQHKPGRPLQNEN